jgi:hypothetical protein
VTEDKTSSAKAATEASMRDMAAPAEGEHFAR